MLKNWSKFQVDPIYGSYGKLQFFQISLFLTRKYKRLSFNQWLISGDRVVDPSQNFWEIFLIGNSYKSWMALRKHLKDSSGVGSFLISLKIGLIENFYTNFHFKKIKDNCGKCRYLFEDVMPIFFNFLFVIFSSKEDCL